MQTGAAGRTRPWAAIFVILALGLCVFWPAVLYWAFEVAPVEARGGIVQKIFYFHVPSAIAMYLAFGVCGVASVAYLITLGPRWDAAAEAGAEVGLLFGGLVLVTGPLWGRGAWGAWWAWEDPQLMATLLLVLIYVTYLFLRRFLGHAPAARRVPAILAAVGLLDIPLIHVATRLWRGQHPRVMRSGGGGLAPAMLQAFLLGAAAFTLLAVALVWLRWRVAWASRRCDDLMLDLEERSLPPGPGAAKGGNGWSAATAALLVAGLLALGVALPWPAVGARKAWAQGQPPAPAAAAQPAEARTTRPAVGAPAPSASPAAAPAAVLRQGGLGFRLMVAAYGIIWLACLLYVVYLGRRQARVERTLDDLQAQIAAAPRAPVLDSSDRGAVG